MITLVSKITYFSFFSGAVMLKVCTICGFFSVKEINHLLGVGRSVETNVNSVNS